MTLGAPSNYYLANNFSLNCYFFGVLCLPSSMSTLHGASRAGDTKLVKQLLDQGVPVDEKDKEGNTALMEASLHGQTEVVKLLIDKGALFDAMDARGDTALLVLAGVDEDHLGRMAAFQVHRHLLQQSGVLASRMLATPEATPEATAGATATAVLNLVRLAGSAADRARKLRSSDPRSADGYQALFARLQLAAAACAQNDESGTARGDKEVQKLFSSKDGHKTLEHAVQIEAKELLAQPVVQAYVMVAWRGPLDMDDLEAAWAQWLAVVIVLLLNLLFLLPLVALVPALEPWLTKRMDTGDGMNFYLLRLPAVKFGLECAADLALALALTVIPAADLATAPLAPLLLVWVASGLLREGGQIKGQASSSAIASLRARRLAHVREQFATIWSERARSCRAGCKICYAASLVALRWLACLLDRLTAYWADHINRVDTTALVFSFAALVASLFRADDNEHATTVTRLAGGGGSALAGTATSLRAVAVLLLWFRLFRVLLISPRFGPFVRMFFRMLFGDLLNFMVLLFFLLVAFAASWTVLLAPHPSLVAQQFSGDEQVWRWTISPVAYLETAGCANELGGVDFFSTLQTLLEGALTGNDFFACARDSTESPWAAWSLSLVFVTLTTVLLLNMLIAMCAANKEKTPKAVASHRTSPWTLTDHRPRCVLRHMCTGWPRHLTTFRRRRRPTISSSSRRGRLLSKTSHRRLHRSTHWGCRAKGFSCFGVCCARRTRLRRRIKTRQLRRRLCGRRQMRRRLGGRLLRHHLRRVRPAKEHAVKGRASRTQKRPSRLRSRHSRRRSQNTSLTTKTTRRRRIAGAPL